MFTDLIPGYKKNIHTKCRKPFQSYTNLIEAQIHCNRDRNCFGIDDHMCDAAGVYGLCYEDSVGTSTSITSTCLFKKGRNYHK